MPPWLPTGRARAEGARDRRRAERGRARAASRRREHVFQPAARVSVLLALAIEYALSEKGLRASTTATNVGTEACPYGSGAHPYLELAAETVDDVVLRVPHGQCALGRPRDPVGWASVDEVELDFRIARPGGVAGWTIASRTSSAARTVSRARAHTSGGCLSNALGHETHPYLMLFTGDRFRTSPGAASRSSP